ncbi:hypothetical protein BDZ94DRAFT_1326555 [Collybia nuda]|uniref:GST N-terminal domain-containing protein n=1 Tax=Collybia nuda TaxID=64659 RepID=A0A9P5XWN4_9AGAR|nr:hypothetical protein BDZ94DRAFT_1326555 [Collybia nuda]
MSIPKAVLYFSPVSVWSAAVLLALEEKGYGDDEVDRRQVNLGRGENFNPTFLRLNPKATVPTLVVPLQRTLANDTESRYKAIVETKAIIEFLDKSRSVISRTRTTSSAPAPTLTPATIAFATTSTTIIDDILHSEGGNPDSLRYLNACDQVTLQVLASKNLPSLTEKFQALESYLSDVQNHVSEKVRSLWRDKKAETMVLLEVYRNADKPNDQLDNDELTKRTEFFKVARDGWGNALREILTRLNKEIIGPYALGDQLSTADLHLAAWMARIVSLAEGAAHDDGNTAIRRLEERIGSGFLLSRDFQLADTRPQHHELEPGYQSKLAAFWDAVRERPSWKKVYANGLY